MSVHVLDQKKAAWLTGCVEKPYKQSTLRSDIQTHSGDAPRFHEVLSNICLAVRVERNICRCKECGKLVVVVPESESVISAKTFTKASSNPTWAIPNCVISREVHSPPQNDYYGGDHAAWLRKAAAEMGRPRTYKSARTRSAPPVTRSISSALNFGTTSPHLQTAAGLIDSALATFEALLK